MSARCLDGPTGVHGLAATLWPCRHPRRAWRVLCPPPGVDAQAHLVREGFSAAEIAQVGALVECTDCHRTGWATLHEEQHVIV
jgi:hypothetical protein